MSVFVFVTFAKGPGTGIKLDPASPTFGWADILGNPHVESVGITDPSWSVYREGIRQFQFSNLGMREMWFEFHIPHDYVPNTDLYVHVHWSQAVADTGGAGGAPGQVKWVFEATYAKGHGQAAFPATLTTFLVQTASNIPFQHMLVDTPISSVGGVGSLLNTTDIEPDGIILLRCFRDPSDAADTLNQAPFLHFCDIHYQTSGIMGTKQRAPNFYL